MPEQDVPKLVHELQVHQIELEMQNDELRLTQLGLKEASERFSDLYDFARCPLLTLSERGTVLEANLAAATLLDLERRKLLQQKFTRFILAEAQDTFQLYCQQVLHSGVKQIRELTLRSATGRRLTVRVEGIAAQDLKANETQCRLSLNDITASKEAEAALAAINARLDGVISSAMDAIISVDARQHIILFNQAAEKMFGISAPEALRQSLERLIPERYRAAHVRHVSQYGETGVSSRSMGRQSALLGLRASGEEFPIEASISQVEIQGEKLFTVILRDITERKKTEEALQDMALFPQENASPVLRVARDGTLLYANPAADSLLAHWQCGPDGKVPEFVYRTVTAVLESGFSRELELNHAGRDLCFAVTPLGGRNYVNLYASDVTERKRLHEMYRLLSADLEQRVTERTAEARESEARYRSLVTATAQFVWTLNAKGELLEDLPAWRTFTGQSYDEIKGWGWASALHPDDLERTRAAWQHAVATRTLHEIEYRMRRHDGEYRYFAVRGVPVTEADGSVREWVCACTDITEGKAARARRNATNALLGLFARNSSSKEYLGGVIEVIRAWSGCQCVGIRVADQHGAIPYNASVGFDAEFLQVENQLSLKTDNCCVIRTMTQAIEEQDLPLLTPGGSMRCDNMAEFISQLSPQQQVRYLGNCNGAGFKSVAFIPIRFHGETLGAIHLADRRPGRFPSASVAFLESMTPLIGEALQRFHTRAELARHRDHLEVLVRERTGELEAAAGRLRVEAAERQHAQEALQLSADELERSNRDLEQFANVASHDLQEPLRAVSGFIRLLQLRFPDQVDAKAAEYITGACDGAERMERLILGLLAFSRVGTKGGDFVLVDLNAVLGDALRNLAASLKAAQAQVTHDSLPSLRADDTQMTQLFQNLIGNAIKFRGEEPPQIHVGVNREPERWVFSVRDNGISIEPQYFERIFQLFQRLHTRKYYPGTGIGLAICKRIVERHGGTIWVESQPGQGSTFFFSIPEAATR
jgi:PAS domain S-box-containing protein